MTDELLQKIDDAVRALPNLAESFRQTILVTLVGHLPALVAEVRRLRTALQPARCPVCNWPLAESAVMGCVPDNCCQRPKVPA